MSSEQLWYLCEGIHMVAPRSMYKHELLADFAEYLYQYTENYSLFFYVLSRRMSVIKSFSFQMQKKKHIHKQTPIQQWIFYKGKHISFPLIIHTSREENTNQVIRFTVCAEIADSPPDLKRKVFEPSRVGPHHGAAYQYHWSWKVCCGVDVVSINKRP